MIYKRDLIGYGGNFPQALWPHAARVAINFVLNYEEGAELNMMDGDQQSESYLTDIPGIAPLQQQRHLSAESTFEYGSRAGVWRLLNLFADYHIPITLFATGLALERNSILMNALKQSEHEIAGHGYRWINYRDVPIDIERQHIQKTLAIIQQINQKKKIGWYTGRRSENTRELLVEAGIYYDSDSYADDLPYWTLVQNKPHLIIPYSLETNDARFDMVSGWNTAEDFYLYLKACFDCLYREGMHTPKMMSIGLHPRFSGRPARCEAVRRFIDYTQQFTDVWYCRREEIADQWYKFHKYKN